jgi:transcription-repair coupling factor (superfamily II helicase)
LHDRFGKPPEDVQHLLQIVSIKMMCRIANVQAVDAGAKGASIALRNGIFPNPGKLVEWINGQGTLAKLRPDMKLVIMRNWDTPEQRLKGTRQLMQTLVKLAA